MQPLSCPIPNNINPLQSNGFLFSIHKLPEISFFCQEVSIPTISLPAAEISTSLSSTPQPGDMLDFGVLSITFLIDEDMINYTAIYEWLIGLGFPKLHQQFPNWISQHKSFPRDKDGPASMSDGILQVLNSSNNPVKTIMFYDMFPTSIQSLQLQSTSNDTTYLAGTATFRYTLFEII